MAVVIFFINTNHKKCPNILIKGILVAKMISYLCCKMTEEVIFEAHLTN